MHRFSNKSQLAATVCLLLIGCLLVLTSKFASASGIFELNLSSLTDLYGRDLRLDCCSWQNNSSNSFAQAYSSRGALLPALPAQNTASGAEQQCDPTKCQLIVRICVKNYQNQIDASQCTFGELSAQVVKPNEPLSYLQTKPISAAKQNSARRQQQATSRQQPDAYNIHQQRMLQQQPTIMSSGQSRSMRTIAFDQPISFPFNFTWPGAFSLIVDAWYESPTGLQQVLAASPLPLNPMQFQQVRNSHHHHHHHSGGHNQRRLSQVVDQVQVAQQPQQTTTYDLYKKQLIIEHSMRGWLSVKNEWTSGVHKTDAAKLIYSYRVNCQPNYFGEQCNILCRPRDDVYGHFTCSSQGETVCLPGWSGKYCEEPICMPGCHKDQGNCTRPGECNCRFGWQGSSCEQCVRYPGCVHGTCSKPHDCNCEEGWGGHLCNQDLNFCANHQPCKNGGICSYALDAAGEGTYTCACEDGFAGANCERRQSRPQGEQAPQQVSNQVNSTQLPSAAAAVAQLLRPTKQQAAGKRQQQVAAATATATTVAPSAMPAAAADKMFSHLLAPQTVLQTPQVSSLDHRVMIAYGIIIVCMVILVVLLVLRIFFERFSGQMAAAAACGERNIIGPVDAAQHYASGRRSTGRSGRGRNADAAAAMQNQQNIYKSRTSIATDKIPFGADSDEAASYSSSSMNSFTESDSELAPAHLHAQLARHYQRQNYSHQQKQHGRRLAYSQHNLASSSSLHRHDRLRQQAVANYAQSAANLIAGEQPPPPPYSTTTTGPATSLAGASSAASVSRSHPNSAYYGAYGSTYYGRVPHPASLVLVPATAAAQPANPIYSNHNQYGACGGKSQATPDKATACESSSKPTATAATSSGATSSEQNVSTISESVSAAATATRENATNVDDSRRQLYDTSGAAYQPPCYMIYTHIGL